MLALHSSRMSTSTDEFIVNKKETWFITCSRKDCTWFKIDIQTGKRLKSNYFKDYAWATYLTSTNDDTMILGQHAFGGGIPDDIIILNADSFELIWAWNQNTITHT